MELASREVYLYWATAWFIWVHTHYSRNYFTLRETFIRSCQKILAVGVLGEPSINQAKVTFEACEKIYKDFAML